MLSTQLRYVGTTGVRALMGSSMQADVLPVVAAGGYLLCVALS